MLLGADFRPRGKEEVESMYNPRFEKEAFKKEVKQNVKHLFRKEIEEVSQQELYQAVSYAVKEAIIGSRRRSSMRRTTRKLSIICLWSF